MHMIACKIKQSHWVFGIALILFTKLCFAYETTVPRYALIIGNSNYKFSPLKNPSNDAKDMASTLKSIRYNVTVGLNQNPKQFKKLVDNFYKNIKDENAISIFYYAGHAIQSNNINYLIPINAGISSHDLLQTNAFSTEDLLKSLRRSSSKQNIIILDACRNNPFELRKPGQKSRGFTISDKKLSSLPRGLAPIEAPTGTLIAYSTEPGNTASDGKGLNGTYTSSLLRHITKSETAEALFKEVRRDVLNATHNRQTPWEHSSLTEKFYFIPPSNEEIPDIISF